MADINVTEEIIDINVTEEVITIAAGNGAYPLAYPVYSVFGRTGDVVALEGDYSLTKLSDVTLTSPANGQVLRYNGTSWVNQTETYVGTVTSVGMTVPTGLSISGSPITTSGTLALSLQTGYSIPTNTSQTNWDNAYNYMITSAGSPLNIAYNTITISQSNTSTNGYLSSTDWNTFNSKYGGTGTTNTLPKFTGTSAIGNSNITDDGSLITLGSNTYISNGGLGIGTSTITGYGIRINKNITGATTAYGITIDGTIQSDVTTVRMYNSSPTTAAAAFTLSSLQHYTAGTTTLGAGSSITNQYGFLVLANLTGATTNYGFNGQLAAATNTWNLYMSGTANNYMAGSLGIGSTTLTGYNLRLGKTITGTSNASSIYNAGEIQSDVSVATYFLSVASTAAASFTISSLYHFRTNQSTFGAGSTVTTQVGYYADPSLIGAANNYGFQGVIPSGTGRYNLYMSGTADNYLAGTLGIGTNQPTAGPILTISLVDGGTGYVDGTYTDVPLTGGNGAGALATIGVSSGVVNSLTLTWGGSNFVAGNTLSASNANLGGTGSGLSISVVTVDSSLLKIASSTAASIMLRRASSVVAGDEYGSLEWENSDSSTKASGLQAKITAYSAGSGAGSYLSFFTRSVTTGTSLVEALRIGSEGNIGIGAITISAYGLRISKNLTGGTTAYGISQDGIIQSGVTGSAYYNYTSAQTAAASFTLTSVNHYAALQGTFGAGSTVTNQYGFIAANTLIGATNNYAFYGLIPSGTGRWNLYMAGTADNYLAGNTGIGGAANSVGSGSILTTTLTNGGSGYVDGTYTDVAVTAISTGGTYALFTIVVASGIVTTATLTWGGANYKVGDTITVSNTLLGGTGSGLIITVATVDSSLLKISSSSVTGSDLSLYRSSTSLAVTNPIGAIKWEGNDATSKGSGVYAKIGAYAAGSAGGAYLSFFTSTGSGGALTEQLRIGNGGQVGIGGAYSLTGYNLRISKNVTGSVSSFGVQFDGEIQSDVTNQAIIYRSFPSTAAASFTLGSLYHYSATNGTLGSGSAITNQYGYWVSTSFTNATNNYAFYSDLGAGTNRWNLYMNGTANNYLAGSLGIGSTSLTGLSLVISKNITGATTSYGVYSNGTIQSDVTTTAFMYRSVASTAAASFTLTDLIHFNAGQGTFGAGSTVNTQYGFNVSSSLIGATTNYGFFGNIPSGTGRWNLYMVGTAQNYLAGNTGIGVAAKTTAELSLGAGTTAQAQINLASSTAPTSPQDGDIWFDGTALKIRIGGVTKTFTVT